MSGATAVDELGRNNGTYSNVSLNQPGALACDTNGSVSLDGSSSYMTAPSSSSLNMTSAVTVEFWAKRRSISGTYQVAVGKPGDGLSRNENYAVWLVPGNKYTAYFGNGASVVSVQTPPINDTNWHYIVATNDGSTARMYLDGVLKQSAPMTIALTPNTRPLNIGRAYSNTYFFNGWLDEIAVYSSALSATAVQGHYAKGTSDLVPPCFTLTSPANGSTLSSPAVTFSGSAGSATGDSSTVTVNVYSGTSASGTPAQTLTTTRLADSSYAVSTNLPNGTWTAQAQQSTTGGSTGYSSANTFVVNTAGPPAPGITSGPADPSSSSSASFAFSDSQTGVSFSCSLDGGAFAACTSPQSYSSLADGSHTFRVKAVDAGGNTSAASTYSWTVDTTPPPAPTLTGTPNDPSGSSSASFSFSDSQTGVSYSCSLDGGAFAACTSPQSYTGLADGSHTFRVKAADVAGNLSAASAYGWTVDTTPPPAPTLTGTPPDPSNSSSASFSFGDSESGASFSCSLDGGAFAACTSPQSYSGLADGNHTFRVKAADVLGNTSIPTAYTWTINTAGPPAPGITSAPADPSNSGSASFSFSDSQTGVSFSCSLDGAGFGACTSPQSYSSLADGSHTFRVKAVDAVGNTSAASTYGWTIDTTPPPAPTLTGTPNDPSGSSSASFSFSDGESGASFSCSLDGGGFGPCTSPQSYSGLADGSHTFRVKAADVAGNLSAASAYSWTVDTTPPPAPTLTGTPPDPSGSSSASFSFSDGESGASFSCSLDGGAFAACTSPQSYSGLADGSHTFRVKAADALGNTSTANNYTWTINTGGPPAPDLTSTPADPSNSSSASFAFSDTQTGASFSCSLDGAAFSACTSPQSYTGLADGSHTFRVKAVDVFGNAGTARAYSWTVDTTPPTVTLTSPANGANPLEWPTFTGSGGTAGGDSAAVTVRVYTGSAATGTPIQTLTASRGTGGAYSVAASAPLNPGTYTAQSRQNDGAGNTGSSSANTFTVGDPVVLAAGGIASCSDSGDTRTKNIIASYPDAMVQTLGNHAYEYGWLSQFQNCYDPTWGFALPRTRPVPGNHDFYNISGGDPPGYGYETYFANQLASLGPTASDPTKLYYSYDIGAWHVVALNDMCNDGSDPTPGCDEAAQEQWLRNDLAAHTNQCVLAVSNRPRWSSDSGSGDRVRSAAFWSIFYQYGVDLVLNGGTHHYERFAPQNPDGNYDPTYGIREIISAHGGAYSVSEGTPDPNSLVYDDTSYGVLKLTLHASSYDWQFLPVADGIDPAGGSFTDSGSATCHGPPPALALPYRDQVLAGSPGSYWRLGETSGTTASDELGRNPGTYSNVLLNEPGALTGDSNASASFNGTTSYMTVPSASSLNMTSGGSVEFWAKRRSVSSTYQVVVGKPGDGLSRNENYSIWLGTSNKYTAYFGNGASAISVQTPAINDTNWHYIVATNDGSTAKIYVDGVLKQSAPMTIALTPNTKALNIGRAYNNTYFFNGWLDEVAVYPAALSSTTIQSHYSEGVSP